MYLELVENILHKDNQLTKCIGWTYDFVFQWLYLPIVHFFHSNECVISLSMRYMTLWYI